SMTARSIAFWDTEVPFQRDSLALGVAHNALAVAPELRIIAGQQHQTSHYSGTKFLEHRAIAVVAVQLPMWRHRAKIHDAHASSWWLVDDVGHGFLLRRSGDQGGLRPRGGHATAARRMECIGRGAWLSPPDGGIKPDFNGNQITSRDVYT